MKKRLVLEILISAVLVFDIVGYYALQLPIWQFFPMWAGAIVEIEVGARILTWLSKRVHALGPFRLGQARRG